MPGNLLNHNSTVTRHINSLIYLNENQVITMPSKIKKMENES